MILLYELCKLLLQITLFVILILVGSRRYTGNDIILSMVHIIVPLVLVLASMVIILYIALGNSLGELDHKSSINFYIIAILVGLVLSMIYIYVG